jgi:hypothetical protein
MARRKRAFAPERRFRVGRFLTNLWPDHGAAPPRAAVIIDGALECPLDATS